MKKVLIFLITAILVTGCSQGLDKKSDSITDDETKSTSIDLGTKEEITSDIYNKYFKDFNTNVKYDDNVENNGRMEVNKIDDNRSVFIGNGSYMSFLPEKSQFYIDYNYDSEDFTLSYIIFSGETINNQVLEEDLIIEFIKENDVVNVNQENLNGEEKSVINFDENYKKEVIETVKNFVNNQLFKNQI